MMEQLLQSLVEGQRLLQEQARADRELMIKAYEAAQTQQAEALEKVAMAFSEARINPPAPAHHLAKFQEGEDPAIFFTNFESVATQAGWPQEQWGIYIAPLLSGKLQIACQSANLTGDTPYLKFKKSILERLGLNPEFYRLKARAEKLQPGDTPQALYSRIKDACDRWLQPNEQSKQGIMDLIYLEQFIEALPPWMQVCIREHPAVSIHEAVDMATAYQRIQVGNPSPLLNQKPGPSTPPTGEGRTIPKAPLQSLVFGEERGQRSHEGHIKPQCFECGQWNHTAIFCPHKPTEEKVEKTNIEGAGFVSVRPAVIVRIKEEEHSVYDLQCKDGTQSITQEIGPSDRDSQFPEIRQRMQEMQPVKAPQGSAKRKMKYTRGLRGRNCQGPMQWDIVVEKRDQSVGHHLGSEETVLVKREWSMGVCQSSEEREAMKRNEEAETPVEDCHGSTERKMKSKLGSHARNCQSSKEESMKEDNQSVRLHQVSNESVVVKEEVEPSVGVCTFLEARAVIKDEKRQVTNHLCSDDSKVIEEEIQQSVIDPKESGEIDAIKEEEPLLGNVQEEPNSIKLIKSPFESQQDFEVNGGIKEEEEGLPTVCDMTASDLTERRDVENPTADNLTRTSEGNKRKHFSTFKKQQSSFP
ncbi:uncharacterized protein [Ambystoma mexicanum]|uniref:uncharacterized protein isoform X4 n=1 Tax=Ambystoma mexicanum TaxID=8296 RepID=UPI0037E8C45A